MPERALVVAVLVGQVAIGGDELRPRLAEDRIEPVRRLLRHAVEVLARQLELSGLVEDVRHREARHLVVAGGGLDLVEVGEGEAAALHALRESFECAVAMACGQASAAAREPIGASQLLVPELRTQVGLRTQDVLERRHRLASLPQPRVRDAGEVLRARVIHGVTPDLGERSDGALEIATLVVGAAEHEVELFADVLELCVLEVARAVRRDRGQHLVVGLERARQRGQPRQRAAAMGIASARVGDVEEQRASRGEEAEPVQRSREAPARGRVGARQIARRTRERDRGVLELVGGVVSLGAGQGRVDGRRLHAEEDHGQERRQHRPLAVRRRGFLTVCPVPSRVDSEPSRYACVTRAGGPMSTAFAVYRRYYGFVRHALLRARVAEADVDDAVHEVFIVLLRKLGRDAGGDDLRAWLFEVSRRIAANRRRAWLRHERKRRVLLPAPDTATPEDAIARHEAAQQLADFVASLAPEERAVFLMAEIEGAPGRVVAERLGLQLHTAYRRMRAVAIGSRPRSASPRDRAARCAACSRCRCDSPRPGGRPCSRRRCSR